MEPTSGGSHLRVTRKYTFDSVPNCYESHKLMIEKLWQITCKGMEFVLQIELNLAHRKKLKGLLNAHTFLWKRPKRTPHKVALAALSAAPTPTQIRGNLSINLVASDWDFSLTLSGCPAL